MKKGASSALETKKALLTLAAPNHETLCLRIFIIQSEFGYGIVIRILYLYTPIEKEKAICT